MVRKVFTYFNTRYERLGFDIIKSVYDPIHELVQTRAVIILLNFDDDELFMSVCVLKSSRITMSCGTALIYSKRVENSEEFTLEKFTRQVA